MSAQPRRGENARTESYRPPSSVTICRCGSYYVDDEGGRAAHRVVFGHQPAAKDNRDEP